LKEQKKTQHFILV